MTASSAHQGLLSLLDDAPMQPAHYRLWLLACGGTLLDGFSIFVLGVALPLIVNELQIDLTTVGLIGAAVVFGAVIGAAVGGPAGDRFGRKKLMLVDMAVIAAGALLSATASSSVQIFLGQLLVGIGVGIDFPVGGSYVSEYMPSRTRGRMMVATIACQSVGMLLAAVVSMLVLKFAAGPQAWRGFLAVDGVAAALFLILRLSLPESVRWLLSEGRNREAAEMLARVLPQDKEAAESLAAEAGTAKHEESLVETNDKPLGWSALFAPAYRQRTLLVSLPWLLMDVATYGVGLFTPVILSSVHLASSGGSPVAGVFSDIKGSGAVDLFLLVGFLVGVWAVPRAGRIRMQIIGFGGMAVGMLTLFFATRLPGGPSEHVPLVMTGFVIFNLLMNAGPNATTFTLPPELFPTQLRASASGFAAGFAKVGATLGVFVLPIFKGSFGISAVMALMAVVSTLGLLVTAIVNRRIGENVTLESHQRPATATNLG